jgi:glycosyltransferase involved in cell wall biosynthesis
MANSARLSSPNIIAAIPCFNEQGFIGGVVTGTKKHVNKVIVIDDGSTDNTSEVARAAGAEVIRHEVRRGAGVATKSGFEAAKANNADVLVTLDGDGQHNPDEITRLLSAILTQKADLVIGSRFLKTETNVPRYRKFGIDVITWLYNFGSRVKVSDSQSCFRAYSRRLLEAINTIEKGFGFSVEVLIQARKRGFRIIEVPISCVYHSQGSSLNPVIHGIGVAISVIKLRLRDEIFTKKERQE